MERRARWVVAALVLAALAGAEAAEAAEQTLVGGSRPDFSGTWLENLKASRTGDGKDLTAEFKRQAITLDQVDTRLKVTIDIKAIDPQQDRVLSFELSTEGRVREFELQGLRALGYARWEGSKLTTYTRRALPGGGVLEVMRTMSPGPDARSMSGKMRAWVDGAATDYSEVWERQ